MRRGAGRAHDVLGLDAAHEQGIGDERAMAAPGQGLGAHQGKAVLARKQDQLLEILLELRRLHVIGIAAKRGVAPAAVDRVAPGMPQAAQPRHVNIADAGFFQRSRQRCLVELRVARRARQRAHVGYARDAVRAKQLDELVDRTRRMADGQDRHSFAYRFMR